jgi:hypothetical protein
MSFDPSDPFDPDDMMSSRTVAYPQDVKPDKLTFEGSNEDVSYDVQKGLDDLLDDEFIEIEEVEEDLPPDEK